MVKILSELCSLTVAVTARGLNELAPEMTGLNKFDLFLYSPCPSSGHYLAPARIESVSYVTMHSMLKLSH